MTTPPWCLKLFSSTLEFFLGSVNTWPSWSEQLSCSLHPHSATGHRILLASATRNLSLTALCLPHSKASSPRCPAPPPPPCRHTLHSPHTLSSLPDNSSQFVILHSLFDQGCFLLLSQEIWGGRHQVLFFFF